MQIFKLCFLGKANYLCIFKIIRKRRRAFGGFGASVFCKICNYFLESKQHLQINIPTKNMTPKNSQLPTQNQGPEDDYVLTLYEVCEMLGKSSRTITRYVQRHILHPRALKSCQGTLEYRFSKSEIRRVRDNEKNLRPYLFTENDRPSPLPDYPSASFAAYNYSPSMPASASLPYLAPGVSFPMNQNQFHQVPPPAFFPSVVPSQNFAGEFLEKEMELGSRKNRPKEGPAKKALKKSEPEKIEKESGRDRASEEIVSLLKETTEMLRGQLKAKDDQIKNLDDKIGQLIERNRETNILLKGLQDKIMLLEQPKIKREIRERPETKPPQAAAALPAIRREEPVPATESVAVVMSATPSENLDCRRLPVPPERRNSDDETGAKKKGLFGKIFG